MSNFGALLNEHFKGLNDLHIYIYIYCDLTDINWQVLCDFNDILISLFSPRSKTM